MFSLFLNDKESVGHFRGTPKNENCVILQIILDIFLCKNRLVMRWLISKVFIFGLQFV